MTLDSHNFSMKAIGFVESCYLDRFGTPRQPGLVKSSWGKIHLQKEWHPQQSLEGLSGFSHLWVIFVFHQNTNSRFHAKVHPPRLGGANMGVFATRSPHRPNSIGLSLVKIESIESDGVVVSGIDLVNGTPVLDIKPYLPEIEAIPEAKAGWSEQLVKTKITVLWSHEQLEFLAKWQSESGRSHLRQLIEETLILDPRPLIYRGYEGKASPYRETHAVRIFDGDVHFSFIDNERIQIIDISRHTLE